MQEIYTSGKGTALRVLINILFSVSERKSGRWSYIHRYAARRLWSRPDTRWWQRSAVVVCSDYEGGAWSEKVMYKIRGKIIQGRAAHFLPVFEAIRIGELFAGRTTHQPWVLYNFLLVPAFDFGPFLCLRSVIFCQVSNEISYIQYTACNHMLILGLGRRYWCTSNFGQTCLLFWIIVDYSTGTKKVNEIIILIAV